MKFNIYKLNPDHNVIVIPTTSIRPYLSYVLTIIKESQSPRFP